MSQNLKIFTITLHLGVLLYLAYRFGAHPAEHPALCVLAAFSTFVIIRTLCR